MESHCRFRDRLCIHIAKTIALPASLVALPFEEIAVWLDCIHCDRPLCKRFAAKNLFPIFWFIVILFLPFQFQNLQYTFDSILLVATLDRCRFTAAFAINRTKWNFDIASGVFAVLSCVDRFYYSKYHVFQPILASSAGLHKPRLTIQISAEFLKIC